MKVIRKDTPKINPAHAEAAWAFAKTRPSFGYKDIAEFLHCTMVRAERIVKMWDTSGVLIVVDPLGVRRQPASWRVNPDCNLPPIAQARCAEDNLWTAMRHTTTFAPSDLAIQASTEEIPVGLDGASVYCRALLQSGYLRVIVKANPPLTEARYRLIKNTGPRAPLIRRVRALVDLNTEAVTLLSEVGQ